MPSWRCQYQSVLKSESRVVLQTNGSAQVAPWWKGDSSACADGSIDSCCVNRLPVGLGTVIERCAVTIRASRGREHNCRDTLQKQHTACHIVALPPRRAAVQRESELTFSHTPGGGRSSLSDRRATAYCTDCSVRSPPLTCHAAHTYLHTSATFRRCLSATRGALKLDLASGDMPAPATRRRPPGARGPSRQHAAAALVDVAAART